MASTNIQTFPGKVGVSNTNPIHTLDIGSNVYIDDTAQTKLRIIGNIHASGVTVDGTITAIDSENLSVKDPIILLASGSTGTSDTGIIMKRADGDSNVAVFYDEGVGLKIGHTLSTAQDIHISVDSSNSLSTSIYGPVTVAHSSAQALVVQGGAEIADDFKVGTSKLFVDVSESNVGIGTDAPLATLDVHGTANVGALTVVSISGDGSALSSIQSSNVSDFASNVGRIETLETDLTSNVTRITNLESSDMTIGGEKTFSSNLEVGTANLFVDTTTSNVGVGTTSPTSKLHVFGDVQLNDIFTINSSVGNIKKKTFTNYNNNGSTRYWKVASGTYDGTRRNQIKMVVNIHRVDYPNSTHRLVMEADTDALTFLPCIDEHSTGTPSYPRDLRVYKNTSDNTFDIYIQASSYTYVAVEVLYSGSSITLYDTPTWTTTEPTTSGTYTLEFTNGNLNAMKIANNGNVGIGTLSPQEKLHVYTDSAGSGTQLLIRNANASNRAGLSLINSDNEHLSIQHTSGGSNVAIIENYSQTNGGVNFYTKGDGRYEFRTTNSNSLRMVIDNNGSVGIGTASPSVPLHISSFNFISDAVGPAASANNVFRVSSTEVDSTLLIGASDTGSYISSFSKSNFATERNLILNANGGNVGIGTTSPGLPLEIYTGNGADYALRLKRYPTGAAYSDIGHISTPGTEGLSFKVSDGNQTTQEVMRVCGNGNVGIGTTSPSSLLTVNSIPAHRHTYDHSEAPLTATYTATPTSNTTLNDPKSVLHLAREGTSGEAYGARASFKLSRYENNGTDSRTRLDLNLAHTNYDDVNVMTFSSSGNVGIGTTDPGYTLDVNGTFRTSTGYSIKSVSGSASFTFDNTGAGPTLDTTINNLTRDGSTSFQKLLRWYGTTSSGSGRAWYWGFSGDQNAQLGLGFDGGGGNDPDIAFSFFTNGTFYAKYGDFANSVSTPTINLDATMFHNGNTTTYMNFGTDSINFQVWPGGGGDDKTSMQITGSGGLAISRNHAASPLISTSMSSGYPTIYLQRYSNSWRMLHFGNNNLDFDWNGSTKGYIITSRTNVMNFTGQHRCFVYDVKAYEIEDNVGLIVSANKNTYYDMNSREDKETDEINTGNKAISINESLPLVSLSNVAYDKSCFGVISDGEDPNSYTREQAHGSFVSVYDKQLGDTRVFINSVGEGSIWVINVNGNLESGDYITTSNVTGYGMKQDSEFMANYTVAKITMDCDFNPRVQPVKKVVKEMKDVMYWVKRYTEKVSYERYLELDEDSRTTEIETYYKKLSTSDSDLPDEISEHDYNRLSEKEKSDFEAQTRTIYKEKVVRKRKTEEENYVQEVHNELVNKVNEYGELQWEDDPDGATEKSYEIRYITSNGTQTDEANAVHIAAFVGCTYHCG